MRRLVKHEGKPQGGIEVVPAAGQRDLASELLQLVLAVGLTPADVIWTRGDIKRPLEDLLRSALQALSGQR